MIHFTPTGIGLSGDVEVVALEVLEDGEELRQSRVQVASHVLLVPRVAGVVFSETEACRENVSLNRHIFTFHLTKWQ